MPAGWRGQSWSHPESGVLFLSVLRPQVEPCLAECCCTASQVNLFLASLHSQQMGPSNSFGIPRVPPPPAGHCGGGRSVHEEMPWLCLGDCVVSGIARRHCVKCRCGPWSPASFWERCCVPGAVQVPLQPGLMQPLSSGIARHMGLVHVSFWLLSNCIIGLSQKNTPSV